MTNIVIDGKEYTPEEVAVLSKAGVLNLGQKHDTSAATPTAQALHGPFPGNNDQFGPLSGAGVRPGMYSTLTRVRSLSRVIPTIATDLFQENIEILTGVTAGSGNNSTSACAVGPKAGDLKVMRQVYTFGIVHGSTRIDDITQVGLRRDRADVDRQVYNTVSGETALLPQVPGIGGSGIIASRLRSSFYTLGVDFERNISQVHYVGVGGTEDNTYRHVARQWVGLDNQIKTGYTDSVTGLAAPAADSVIESFNAPLTGTDGYGRDIVEAITDTFYSVWTRANDMGLDGVQWAIAMRPEQFRELCKQFAYALPVYTGAGTQEAPLNREGVEANRMFLDMFNGRYLLIDGMQVPVILDNAIARETLGNNYYKADIYFVPLSWAGRPLLYFQYFNMANSEANEIATAFGVDGTTTTVNNGLYRVFRRVTGGCVEFDLFARVRLILDTPFLAARLDDVFYNSFTKHREPQPGFSMYANGGVTYRE